MFEFYARSVQDPFQYQGRLHAFKFDTRRDYPESVRTATREWVRFISTYTRYSGPRLFERHDFSAYGRLLDVGGNNGELAIQACRRHLNLRVTVFDIPVVCDLGAEHVAAAGLSSRIEFVKGDLRADALPAGFDAVVCSSFLHDHGDEAVQQFLGKIHAALKPGGRVIIWETHGFDLRGRGYAESDMDLFPFIASFGPPDRYNAPLERNGFVEVRRTTDEEIGFLHTEAVRPR
jgi:SAM-dependent methyltransferase